LRQKGLDVRVANVLQLRSLIGKNDRLDAKRLADMLRLNTLPVSYIPDESICMLRSLTNLHYNCVKDKTKLKNQIHGILDQHGISFHLRTAFCKAWCACLEEYLKNYPSFELQHLYAAVKDAEQRRIEIDAEIDRFVNVNFKTTHALLTSIPGIGPVWSAFIIANVMPICRFASKKKLRRYAGVVPVSNQSDDKVYSTYLPKVSSRTMLRYALVQASHSAVQTNGRLKEYYRKKKHNSKPCKAIMCVASSLSDIIYAVLNTRKPYTITQVSGDVGCP
jgi:transposase